jgi:hypothetical protein
MSAAEQVGNLILGLERGPAVAGQMVPPYHPEDIQEIKDKIRESGVTKGQVAEYLTAYWNKEKEEGAKVTEYPDAGVGAKFMAEESAKTRASTADRKKDLDMKKLDIVFTGGRRKTRKGKKRTTRKKRATRRR